MVHIDSNKKLDELIDEPLLEPKKNIKNQLTKSYRYNNNNVHEAYSKLYQASKMERFVKIFNEF